MHLTAPIQLLLVALAATQASASPLAALISGGVEIRTAHGAVEKRSFGICVTAAIWVLSPAVPYCSACVAEQAVWTPMLTWFSTRVSPTVTED